MSSDATERTHSRASRRATRVVPCLFLVLEAARLDGGGLRIARGILAPVERRWPANVVRPRCHPEVEVGVPGIFEAYARLENGGRIDVTGATGKLDFDLATGESAFDHSILCAVPDGAGQACPCIPHEPGPDRRKRDSRSGRSKSERWLPVRPMTRYAMRPGQVKGAP